MAIINSDTINILCFPLAAVVKNLPAVQETQVRSQVGKMPWRRGWQPSPVFLPEQRSLVGYSLAELDTTEQLTLEYMSINCKTVNFIAAAAATAAKSLQS